MKNIFVYFNSKLNSLLVLMMFVCSANGAIHPLPSGKPPAYAGSGNDRCIFGTTNCLGSPDNPYHLGVDLMAPSGAIVKAMCNGVVVLNNTTNNSNLVYNSFLTIEHNCGEGHKKVYAYYVHIYSSLENGVAVREGDEVGSVLYWGNNSHLHMGVSYTNYNNGVGYGNQAKLDTFFDFRDLITKFHGAGSMINIDPAKVCFGCNKDTDALHVDGSDGLILYQWYANGNTCDHIDIKADSTIPYDYYVQIRSGPWSDRKSDKYYVAKLPVSIKRDKSTPWNVTAIRFDPHENAPSTITATCSVSNELGVSTKKEITQANPLGINLGNGWMWQGNGSLISDIGGYGYGITQDVVNLNHQKGAAFFQWKKSYSCKNLNISAGIPGNYKLRMRGWSSSPDNNIIARDIYLSGNQSTALNNLELLNTTDGYYYLLSIYSDINFSTTQSNAINVSCSLY